MPFLESGIIFCCAFSSFFVVFVAFEEGGQETNTSTCHE